MNSETLKLKPCPFCGDTAKLDYDILDQAFRIECDGCWVVMNDGMDEGAEALVEAWNTRGSE